MPILNIVIRGDNVAKITSVQTERPIRITFLKLNHVYHNLSATNLSDTTDRKQQKLMFLRLHNLLSSADKSLTYVGDWDNMTANATQNIYNVDYETTNGFCIGSSKHNNSAEIVSKEMFQIIHEDHEPIEWDGQFAIELMYLDKEGKLAKWNQSNTYSSSNLTNTSFVALQFEYHESHN